MAQDRSRKNNNNQVTWAKAFRDIVVSSINKGQFPLVALFLLLVIISWRIPSEVIGKVVEDVMYSGNRGIYGYILSLIIALVWFVHSKKMRREHSDELERIGTEKSKLQSKASNRNFKSSNQ
ncbi:hypothetical protein [Glaciecola sp. SC05]|uniref:hypothetical protein n=1 Tax=Glaciecola sp. SC05 TaxID=1987355 RepID=UPI00352826E6